MKYNKTLSRGLFFQFLQNVFALRQLLHALWCTYRVGCFQPLQLAILSWLELLQAAALSCLAVTAQRQLCSYKRLEECVSKSVSKIRVSTSMSLLAERVLMSMATLLIWIYFSVTVMTAITCIRAVCSWGWRSASAREQLHLLWGLGFCDICMLSYLISYISLWNHMCYHKQ